MKIKLCKDCRTSIRISGWTSFRRRWVFSNLTGKLINTDDVTTGVDVEVGKTQVAVDLKVVTEYRKNVPDIYEKLKKSFVKRLRQ